MAPPLLRQLLLTAASLAVAAAERAWEVRASPGHGLGPGRGAWRVEPPEQHGLSTALLAKAAETIRTRAQERYCLLVIKDGVIVHETYYANTSSSVYESDSLAKTTTAALLGVAVQDGLLDIDRPLREYGVEPHAIWQQPNGSDYCPGPCEQFKRP